MSFNPPSPPTFTNRPGRRTPSEPRWRVQRYSRPQSVPMNSKLTRRFEIEWWEDGEVKTQSRVAPALPVFEQAFGAFSHGILIQTSEGPVAVEDLEPGMMLETPEGHHVRLIWKGAITLVPGAPSLSEIPDKLYRVMPDAFGLGRPTQDQTFGPHVRHMNRDPNIRAAMGAECALVPLSNSVDGMSIIEVTPVAPTRVYHLACERHETILAAGVEVETYHPGPDVALSLSEEMMRHFLMFFPYIGNIRDFGRLAAPRINAEDIDAFD
ncbi:MAG: Hint domain-containing protein [Boseongicola sp.]|nr:Hint domain-containing protein [Boseongicola sp.]